MDTGGRIELARLVLNTALACIQPPGAEVVASLAELAQAVIRPKDKGEKSIRVTVNAIIKEQSNGVDGLRQFETDIPPNEVALCAETAQERYKSLSLTFERIEEAEFDPNKIFRPVENALEAQALSVGLSEPAREYTRQLVILMLRQTVALVTSLPRVQSDWHMRTYLATKQAPARIVDALEGVLTPPYRRGTEFEHAEFTTDFLEELIRIYGRTRLFGLDEDVPPALASAPIDLTYISLSASIPIAKDELKLRSHTSSLSSGIRSGTLEERSIESVLADAGRNTKSARVCIQGLAGSGKTTVLHWLAIQLAKSIGASDSAAALGRLRGRVPFYLPLRSIFTHGSAPATTATLVSQYSRVAEMPGGWLTYVLSAQGGVLLVDGLDELDELRREMALNWVNAMIENFSQLDVIMTTRPEGLPIDFLTENDFSLVELYPLTPKKSKQVIDQWFDAQCTLAPPRLTEIYRGRQAFLVDRLENDQNLRDLAETPLLTAMLCAYFASGSTDQPVDRERLARSVVATLTDGRERARGLTPTHLTTLTLRNKQKILGQAAYEMFMARESKITTKPGGTIANVDALLVGTQTLRFEFAHPSVAIDQAWEYLIKRSAILIRISKSEVVFAHRLFLEYLAADYINQQGKQSVLNSTQSYPGWYSVAQFYASIAPAHSVAEFVDDQLDQFTPTALDRRLAFTLAYCLSAGGLDNFELGEAVKQAVSECLPPETDEEIAQFASLGEAALDLMRTPQSHREALALIATVGRVHTPAAFRLLKKFLDGGSLRNCETQLGQAWSRFPGPDYAREVVANLDGAAFTLQLPSARYAQHLSLLPNLRRLDLGPADGMFGLDELVGLVNLEELDLRAASSLRSLAGLSFLPALRTLRLPQTEWDGTEIESCPSSLRQLVAPNSRWLRALSGIPWSGLRSLELCRLSDQDFPDAVDQPEKLEEIVLDGNPGAVLTWIASASGVRRAVIRVRGAVNRGMTIDLGSLTDLAFCEIRNGGYDREVAVVLPESAVALKGLVLLGQLTVRVPADLEAERAILKGNIKIIRADGTHCGGLDWLASDRLVSVVISDNVHLTSLLGAARMPALHSLDISYTAVSRLSSAQQQGDGLGAPLGRDRVQEAEWSLVSCDQLRVLDISGLALTSLSVLAEMRLERVICHGFDLDAIEFLQWKLPQTELVFDPWVMEFESG